MIRVESLNLSVIGIVLTTYKSNDAIVVLARLKYEDGQIEDCPISVNLNHGPAQDVHSEDLPAGQWFADTNNYNDIVDALIDARWIQKTGEHGQSGFCTYPVCEITAMGATHILSL
jgi:hypothetical protein